MVVVDLD